MLVHTAGLIVLGRAWVFAIVLLLLGLIDFGLCHRRFESMLRSTPEERREDQRAMEGSPEIRSQRRRVALAWRGDSPELFAGASLLLTGTAGLTLVVGGGPPPKRITVRTVVKGPAGMRLRRSPEAAKLPQIESSELARPPGPSPLVSIAYCRRVDRRTRSDMAHGVTQSDESGAGNLPVCSVPSCVLVSLPVSVPYIANGLWTAEAVALALKKMR